MTGISFEQFQTEISEVQKNYHIKARELDSLRMTFETLVNKIELQNKDPDELEIDADSPEYDAKLDAHQDEKDEISETIADIAYDFDLEWSGSFEESDNSFWQPSSC